MQKEEEVCREEEGLRMTEKQDSFTKSNIIKTLIKLESFFKYYCFYDHFMIMCMIQWYHQTKN